MTEAVLRVEHPALMFRRLGGMGVLERQLFLLAAAGIRRVTVTAAHPPEADRMRRPEGLEMIWAAEESGSPADIQTPQLQYCADYLVRRETLEAILAGTSEGYVVYQDEAARDVLRLSASAGAAAGSELRSMPAGSYVRLPEQSPGPADRRWLLDGARKGHDGFMARVFDRHLSLAVTRWLLETPLKPNHMTLISSAIGVLGAAQFARPGRAGNVAGALLVWLHTVLDGCDGEMARLRYQESRFGGVLDFWGDNVVHVALFTAIGLGVAAQNGAAWPLVLGIVAAAASLAAATLTYRISAAKRAESEAGPFFKGLPLETPASGGARTLQRIEDALTQRDFIYLLVGLALVGRLDIFLIAAGIGTPIFFLVLLYLTFQSGARRAETPIRGPQ